MDIKIVERVKEEFAKLFENEATGCVFSPGRINIIGEHIDYNGGNVFPAAIMQGTYVVFRERKDSVVRVFSENFSDVGICSWDISDTQKAEEGRWENFVRAIIVTMKKMGYAINIGFEAYIVGNIPNGAGLSSSASLEMAIAVLVDMQNNLQLDRVALVDIAQKAENEFIGVQCGIMDMFAIGMGKVDNAILLNCATKEFTYAPIKLENHSFLIMNTMKRRALADSKYNERRSECELALAQIKVEFEIDELAELTENDLIYIEKLLANDVLFRRVKHVVTEQKRTESVLNALRQSDLESVGKLLCASHDSLQKDYEVTGKELDALVFYAQQEDGVLGARMTGAGFGGCAIALVENAQIDTIIKHVSEFYSAEIGYSPEFYTTKIGIGTQVIRWKQD